MKNTISTITYGQLATWAGTMPADQEVEIDLLTEQGKVLLRYRTAKVGLILRVLSERKTLALIPPPREYFEPALEDIFGALNCSLPSDEVRDMAEYFWNLADELEDADE